MIHSTTYYKCSRPTWSPDYVNVCPPYLKSVSYWLRKCERYIHKRLIQINEHRSQYTRTAWQSYTREAFITVEFVKHYDLILMGAHTCITYAFSILITLSYCLKIWKRNKGVRMKSYRAISNTKIPMKKTKTVLACRMRERNFQNNGLVKISCKVLLSPRLGQLMEREI